MKRKDLIRQLKQNGWEIIHGGNHDLAKHPDRKVKLTIPRHNEINEHTAKGILRDAGLA